MFQRQHLYCYQGISNLLSDGMAMGLGEAVGELAELEYAEHEVNREKWEFDNYPEVCMGTMCVWVLPIMLH